VLLHRVVSGEIQLHRLTESLGCVRELYLHRLG
jgi:hypothetical protein